MAVGWMILVDGSREEDHLHRDLVDVSFCPSCCCDQAHSSCDAGENDCASCHHPLRIRLVFLTDIDSLESVNVEGRIDRSRLYYNVKDL